MGFAIRHYVEGVRWEGSANFEIAVPPEAGRAPLAGYAWVFPMQGDRANVGVGYFTRPDLPTNLHALLRQFEEQLVRDDPRFAAARAVGQPIGAPIRIGGNSCATHAPGLLLVGDSAGLPNPLWAEGISRALESGVLAAEAALDHLGDGASLAAYGRSLAEQYPTFERIASSLPVLYRNASHVSRGLVPFLRTGTSIARAFFAMVEVDVEEPEASERTACQGDELLLAARSAERRALRLASRDRAFFGEIVGKLLGRPDAPIPVALLFFAARSRLPDAELSARELRRAAVCLELMRVAVALLDDLDVDPHAETRDGARGGGWLAATLAIELAGRVLTRSFAVAGHLAEPLRRVVAEALLVAVEPLAADAAGAAPPSRSALAAALAAAAARAGARLGGAEPGAVDALAQAAAEAARTAAPGELLAEFDARARSIGTARAVTAGSGSAP
jgi:hypothetical protein